MLKGDKIITVSNFIKNHIKTNYNFTDNKKLLTIHRGVDLSEFNEQNVNYTQISTYLTKYNIPKDKKLIILPGRITEWKGQLFFLQALTKISATNYHAIIVGDVDVHSNYKKKLTDFINQHSLNKNITFMPAVRDLVNLYHCADIVISASLRPEAFGRTIVEAGAMGKIVLATKHGGAMETILDNKTGFLFAANSNNELAEKIDYVLKLPKKQLNIIENEAKEHVSKNFSICKMQEATINLYKEILKL